MLTLGNIAHKTRSAKQQLIDAAWCVGIGRDKIEAHAKSDFGPLIAYAAVLAWRDRGPRWALDGERSSAQRPPGGWPDTAGTTAPTWRRWLGRAIEIGLISETHGFNESGHRVDLLRPIKPYRTEEQDQGYEMPVEQFARLPVSVLFDPKIGRTAKRVMVGVAMYRRKSGFARVAVPTIARLAGLNDRNTHKGLRRLELAGAIKSTGLSRQIKTYEIIEQRTDKVNARDTSGERGGHQGDHERHQKAIMSDTTGERGGHQKVNVGDTLSGVYQENTSRKESRKKLQVKGSGGERLSPTNGAKPLRRPQPQNDLGGKEVRQESANVIKLASPDTPEPTPTPERCRERIATLEATLSTMNHCTPGYSTLTQHRDEYLAALSIDTELRASA